MNRRTFCRYILLGTACFGGIVSGELSSAMLNNFPQTRSKHSWVILYWMPYDNNLVIFGEQIVQMLTRATKRSKAAVVVQSDYFGDKKMRRRNLIEGNIQEMEIAGEDSSDISAFSEYLDWANRTFEADRWAIIIVGHGGKINEISPDEHGVSRQKVTWMPIDKLANAVTNFNRATEGRVELLFFQNCNKATLEVIYEARNCARYTLASQRLLGAPNYYYYGFLKKLNNSLLSGRDAAIAITEFERDDMYHTLTLLDNREVENIPSKLSPLIAGIMSDRLPTIERSALLPFHYFDEQYCDLLNLLKYLSKNSDRSENLFNEFAEFLQSNVISYYKKGGTLYERDEFKPKNLDKLCGLSLYLPQTEQSIDRYSSLAIYKKVDLVSLYRRIFAS